MEKTGKPEKTGIFKMPVAGAVEIRVDGLPGDVIISTKHHGGPDQAVYIYGGADYAWWSQQLGYELDPGMFGENLTIDGLECASFSIGDRLQIGDVILEVTAPRIPCSLFARRMGEEDFKQRFRDAGRPGLYTRVINPGFVTAGDEVTVQPYNGETITLVEMYRDYYNHEKDEATLRRHLAAPIAIRARKETEAQLQRLLELKK